MEKESLLNVIICLLREERERLRDRERQRETERNWYLNNSNLLCFKGAFSTAELKQKETTYNKIKTV